MRLASLCCVLALAVVAIACGPSGDSAQAPAAAGGDPPTASAESAPPPPTENPRGATAPVAEQAGAAAAGQEAADPPTPGSAEAAPGAAAQQQVAAAVRPAGAAAAPSGSAVLGDPSKGDAVYQTFCSSCHGPRGDGDGPVAVGLDPKPAKHSDGSYMNTLSNEHLFKVVGEGGPAVGKSPLMAPWAGTLTDAQIRDVIAFVRSLAKPPYEPGA